MSEQQALAPHKRLEAFMRSQLFARKEPATKFTLHHIVNGKIGDPVFSVDVDKDTDGAFVSSSVASFVEAATADAAGLGGLQSYVIRALIGNKSLGRHTFRIEGELEAVSGANSETPDAAGMLTQLMRHNDGYAKIITMGNHTVVDMLAQTMRQVAQATIDAREESRKNEAERLAMFQTMQSLLNEQSMRDIENRKAEAKIEAMHKIGGQLQTLLPVIVGKLGGRKSNGVGSEQPVPNGVRDAIDKLKASLGAKPEKIAALMGILDEDDQGAVMQILSAGSDSGESDDE